MLLQPLGILFIRRPERVSVRKKDRFAHTVHNSNFNLVQAEVLDPCGRNTRVAPLVEPHEVADVLLHLSKHGEQVAVTRTALSTVKMTYNTLEYTLTAKTILTTNTLTTKIQTFSVPANLSS